MAETTFPYTQQVEAMVSRYLGKRWSPDGIFYPELKFLHPNAILRGSGFGAFIKIGERPYSFDQFLQEAQGLQYLSEHTGITVPEVIGVEKVDDAALFVLEEIDCQPVKTDEGWEVLGRGLAQIHSHTLSRCGFPEHNYLGVFRQDNSYSDSWGEFYAERRLSTQLRMAIETGWISTEAVKVVEQLIRKLPGLIDEPDCYSLLHGDPWVGNLLYDGHQMIAIDCCPSYGNREIDLAIVDFFSPVPDRFFDAYGEVLPIPPGFRERKDLWRVYQWLGHVTLLGESYNRQVIETAGRYLFG